MTPRTFTGRTFAEALNKIKRDLGDGAVILKSEKRTRASSFGLGSSEICEVTAASAGEVKADLENGTEFAQELSVQSRDETTARGAAGSTYEIALLRSEVTALRGQLSEIARHFRYNNLPSMPEQLAQSLTKLTEAGLEREMATDLTAEALVQLGPEALASADEISAFVISKLGRIAPPAANRAIGRAGKQTRIALVGAPGAGKTSTLQKLATDPKGYAKQRIGIISLDTHRLAAIEQLRTFARVTGLPLEIVYQPKDAHTALNRLKDAQILLIDTAGCAPGEGQRMSDLAAILDVLQPDETHLVLNATMRTREQVAVVKRFQQLGITHLTMTRLDESQQPGSLVTISHESSKPIAWLASGQSFTGQLERYRPDWLRQRVFGSTVSASEFTPLKAKAPSA